MLRPGTDNDRGFLVTGYRPMTLADLGGRLARTADGKVRWKLVWEFLEEYRWEPADVQPSLLWGTNNESTSRVTRVAS